MHVNLYLANDLTLSLSPLSEWVVKIPIILIMGVATTVDALNMLPSNALKYLHPYKFLLGSPADRMDAVVEAVLVRQCSGFNIGHKVAVFMRKYFLNHDGTITSFIRALKVVYFILRQLIYFSWIILLLFPCGTLRSA